MSTWILVNRVSSKLTRAELNGINAHTLALGVQRIERDQLGVEHLTEREIALALIERSVYPESVAEMNLFLSVPVPLSNTTLLPELITPTHAPTYMRWVAGFLNDPDPNIQKNSRLLLKWLISHHQAAIIADQTSLDMMRHVAADAASIWRSSAYIVYALGMCSTQEDYDTVIYHAEQVIEHDRDNLGMIAEALYRMHPPALISAVQFFLDVTQIPSKQFTAGMQLLARVAEIPNREFWRTYFDDMDGIVTRLADIASKIPAVERIVDQIEKNLAFASVDDE